MKRFTITLLALSGCTQTSAPRADDAGCTMADFCHIEDGVASCIDGYSWANPEDPNDFSCVPTCEPETNDAVCERVGAECGVTVVVDNCGNEREIACGTCAAPDTCGGGLQDNVCGCEGETEAELCAADAVECGDYTTVDSCGEEREITCATCADGSCGGGFVANECGTLTCTVDGWCRSTEWGDGDTDLLGVWVHDDGTAWAAGWNNRATRGRIAQLENGVWRATDATQFAFMAAWGPEADFTWIAGGYGALLEVDAETVTVRDTLMMNEDILAGDIHDLHGTSATDVWTVSWSNYNGSIGHFDGSAWSFEPYEESLYGVWTTGSQVVAVGDRGHIIERVGDQWQTQSTPVIKHLRDVWASDDGSWFAVGQGGTVLTRTASGPWVTSTTPTVKDLNAVFGTSASNVWAVGADGTLLFFDGSTWSAEDSGTTQDLNGVGVGGGEVWVVGEASTLISFAL